MTTRRGLCAAGAALAVALGVLALGLRFGPALAFSVCLASPAADSWLAWAAAAPARDEMAMATAAGTTLRADLYRPAAGARGALVLVHGLSRAGRRHPDLVRLARLLARHGHLVLVPHLEGLAAFRLGGHEIDEIRTALGRARALSGRVAIAGFSFGAGPALVAAAEEPGLAAIGSFGGYADLRHVIRYVTTGTHEFGGRRHADRAEEYNRWKLLSLLAGFIDDPADRGLAQAVAEARLANPGQATDALERGLGAEGRALLALVRNRREDSVPSLLARLPAGAQQALDRLSPLSVVGRLSGRLLIAHGADDSSIPFTESLRLAEAAGGRARVAILRTFQHTGPEPLWRSLADRSADAWSLVGLADALLTAGN
jgi:dienelactone hydrolase